MDGYDEIESTITIEQGMEPLSFQMQLSHVEVCGMIIDALENAPFAGVSVTVRGVESETVIAEATTDEEGGFSFSLIPGSYVIHATMDGYDEIESTITTEQGMEPLSFQMQLSHVDVSGSVIDTLDAAPLAGVAITVRGVDSGTVIAETTTNEEGGFSFTLIPGTYVLNVMMDGYDGIESTITTECGMEPLNFQMQPSHVEVSGTISEALEGMPLPGVTITVKAMGSETIIAEAATDEEGGFSFSLVPGTYAIHMIKTGYDEIESTFIVEHEMESIKYSMQVSQVEVSGAIYDRWEESTLSEVTITVKTVDSETVITEIITDDDGAFTFDLLPGAYVIHLAKDGYSAIESTLTVEFGMESLAYYMQAFLVNVSGVIYDLWENNPLCGVIVTVKAVDNETFIAEGTTDEEGGFSFGLEPGTYVIHAATVDYDEFESTFTVEYGMESLACI